MTEHGELRLQLSAQETSAQTAEDHYRLEGQMTDFDQHHDDSQVVTKLITRGCKLLHDYILNHAQVSGHALAFLAEHGKTKALKAAAAKKARQ